jgi:hypothetical protein
MGQFDERVQAIQHIRGDGGVHETFTLFEERISEVRAQREEKTDRIRWTRRHRDVFRRFARFLSQFQDIIEGVGHSGRQRS